MNRIARLTLLAYPRSFRRAFGREYLRTAADLQMHSPHSSTRLAARLLGDALSTGPAMRWENLMSSAKLVLTVIAVAVAVVGVLFGAPVTTLPLLALLATLVAAARHRDQTPATAAAAWGRRWYLWIAVAIAFLLLGFGMLLTEKDGSLSTLAWAVWILSWLTAAIIATVGLGLGATRVIHQRRA